MMPHAIIMILASLTLGTGLIAAVYWFRSAAAPPPTLEQPIASVVDAPSQYIYTAFADIAALNVAVAESGRLNKCAAIWSGVSVLLGAITTVVSVVGL
jgi:hypothetical protein